mgnify:CR=1 FL=1
MSLQHFISRVEAIDSEPCVGCNNRSICSEGRACGVFMNYVNDGGSSRHTRIEGATKTSPSKELYASLFPARPPEDFDRESTLKICKDLSVIIARFRHKGRYRDLSDLEASEHDEARARRVIMRSHITQHDEAISDETM